MIQTNNNQLKIEIKSYTTYTIYYIIKNYERVRYKQGERYVSLTQQKLYDMPWRNCKPNQNAPNNFFRNVQANFKIIMKIQKP